MVSTVIGQKIRSRTDTYLVQVTAKKVGRQIVMGAGNVAKNSLSKSFTSLDDTLWFQPWTANRSMVQWVPWHELEQLGCVAGLSNQVMLLMSTTMSVVTIERLAFEAL